MFHYTPTSSLYPRTTFPISSYPAAHPHYQPLSPREKYLAAIAEAKAAEEEYLAAEAARREEEALQLRLQELQTLRRREEESRYRSAFNSPYTPATRQIVSDPRLDLLRRRVQEEESLLADANTRSRFRSEPRFPHEELGVELRRAQALALEQAHQRNQEALHLRGHGARQHPVLAPPCLVDQGLHLTDTQTRCPMISGPHVNNAAADMQDSLAQFVSLLSASAQRRGVRTEGEGTTKVLSRPRRNDIPEFQNFWGQFMSAASESEQQPRPIRSQGPSVENASKLVSNLNFSAEGLDQALHALLGATHQPQVAQEKTKDAKKSATNQGDATHNLQEHLASVLGFSLPKQEAPTASASSRPQAPGQPSEVVDLSQFLSAMFGGQPETEKKPQTLSDVKPKATSSIEGSLKEQLESRLNNEYATEIRDTIQALMASLSDAELPPTFRGSALSSGSGSSSASASGGSSKGKAKASPPVTAETATSKDVVHAMNDVRSIEAAFFAVESDFSFPSQLDFTPASLSPPTTPTSSPGAESESSTSKLSFTSRNHPVRFYEQTLSAMLTQLDTVDSLGNEELRRRRKEVVGRVERALEDLEREVEGRWRLTIKKQGNQSQQGDESEVLTPRESGGSEEVTRKVVDQQESRVAGDGVEVAASAPVDDGEARSVSGGEEGVLTAEADVAPKTVADEDQQPLSESDTIDTEAIVASNANAAYTPYHSTSSASASLPELESESESISESTATLQPYDLTPSPSTADRTDTPEEEAYLLAAALSISSSEHARETKRPAFKDDGDAGSDWSEVEA